MTPSGYRIEAIRYARVTARRVKTLAARPSVTKPFAFSRTAAAARATSDLAGTKTVADKKIRRDANGRPTVFASRLTANAGPPRRQERRRWDARCPRRGGGPSGGLSTVGRVARGAVLPGQPAAGRPGGARSRWREEALSLLATPSMSPDDDRSAGASGASPSRRAARRSPSPPRDSSASSAATSPESPRCPSLPLFCVLRLAALLLLFLMINARRVPPAIEATSSSARDCSLLVSYMPLAAQAFKLHRHSLLYYPGCQPKRKRKGCYLCPPLLRGTKSRRESAS